MRLSLKWLQQYIELNTTPEDIAQRLTSVGLEVEGIEYLGKKFDGFMVGYVVKKEKHPNADKLSLCEVQTTDSEISKIVCGAPNIAEGQKVVVATLGAIVPKNQHDPEGKPFTITKAKIRGVESQGMICSAYELGLNSDSAGILVLDANATVGMPFAEYLGIDDVAFEVGVTPNRSDCLGHLGIARELAASFGVQLKKTAATIQAAAAKSNLFSVEVKNSELCPRYAARLISDVKISQSPKWLKNYLEAAGVRSINNVVDVTNFVMLEYNQPLHAFDFNALHGQKIIVKTAKEDEPFTTLDGKTHTLQTNNLMICDAEKAIAIAGVMGGNNSEITEHTSQVILESAYFLPTSIRKTSKQLGISTDASYRFERGIDPNTTVDALNRATALLIELAGGKAEGDVIDNYPNPISATSLDVRTEKVNAILGTNLSQKNIQQALSSICIEAKEISSDVLRCSIPTFRPDITQEIDLVEEVARLHGFSNIEDKMVSEITFGKKISTRGKSEKIQTWLEENGFNEILTNSLLDESLSSLFSSRVIKVLNPISAEQSTMRPSLIPGMLQTVFYNNNHGNKNLRLYEVGRVFQSDKINNAQIIKGYDEQNMLCICLSGQANELSWMQTNRKVDIFDMKGVMESLLSKITLDKFSFICYDAPNSLTEQTINIEINDTYAGYLGKVKEEILQQLKIETEVYVVEINLNILEQQPIKEKKYLSVSKFPPVTRDMAFVVDKQISAESILKNIKEPGGQLLKSVTIFDVFEGKTIGEGKKSIAFNVSFAAERTLTDDEVEKVFNNIIFNVTKTFNAVLRSL